MPKRKITESPQVVIVPGAVVGGLEHTWILKNPRDFVVGWKLFTKRAQKFSYEISLMSVKRVVMGFLGVCCLKCGEQLRKNQLTVI